jgi:outer membrane protein
MASPQITLIFALISADLLQAQTPAPVRLSFADAVRQATGTQAPPPAVSIAGFRLDAASARVRQARAGLLPNLAVSGSWANRNFNSKAQGISFPGVPTIIGPFNAYDGRVRLTQTLFDFSNLGRVNAAKRQASAAGAERSAVVEASAQNVALAYARASRAQAVLAARQADSSLAAELLTLAIAQQQAGVSASIDVTRSRTQLAEAAGRLVVAQNQFDRAKIDLARALGLDPATPVELTDTLTAQMGVADVPPPGERDAAVVQAVAARPDVAAELARGAAARTSASAVSAERLPRLELEADYGLSGVRMPDAMGTRQVAVQVTLPILDGFRREGRIAEQQAVVRESDVRLRDLRLQVAADVDGALLDLRSAAAQEMIATERLQLAAEEVSQARQRFKAGVVGNIEVVTAQASLLRARDADIDARFAAVTARIALARSVGTARTLH